MDDFDIYDDLQLLQEQGKQKAEEDSQWKEKYHVALGTIEKLQTEKKELSKKIKLLETNFSSLLETARTEIKRKDNQISELRREKDDLCFRRVVRPGGKHSHHDVMPPSSRNDNADQGVGAGYTKSFLKNVEENKGNLSECSGQRRNPFQGESSGRLGNSGDKNYKGRNSTKHQHLSHHGDLDSVAPLNTRNVLKQENLKERKTNHTDDIQNNAKALNSDNVASVQSKTEYGCTKESESAEKIMEADILNDLKAFKKRKQCDVMKNSESEEIAITTSNEKSNMFFDALFDDLAMEKENSKEIYSDIEAEIIPEPETNKQKIRDEENSIAGMKAVTPKILNTKKHLDNLFEASPDGRKELGTEQVNSNEMDKKSIIGFEKKHNSSPKKQVVDTLNIVSDCNDPTVEQNDITKTTLKNELNSSNKSTPFKFAELDSSFYSSDDDRDNENGKRNMKESNEETVGDDADKKVESRSKRNKNLHSKSVNKIESTSTSHGSGESKYKDLKEEKNITSRKHTSEHTDTKAAKKDSLRHSNRSKHSESLSRSKLHKHERESREGRSSKASVRNVSSGSEKNNKRKSPLKNEHDLKPNNLNEYVTLEKNEGLNVASQEIKPPSFEEITINNQSVDSKEAFEKITGDASRESIIKQDDLIETNTDKCPKNEIKDNNIKEVHKPLHNALKKTEKKRNEKCNNVEATATTNQHHEEKKDNASSTESVLSNKLPGDINELQTQKLTSNSDMISTSPRDESKNVAKVKQQTRTEHLLKNTDSNTTFNNTKTECEKDGVSSNKSLISSSKDVCTSINLNCEVVSEPIGQIIQDSKVNGEIEKLDQLGTNQSTIPEIVPEPHCDENLRQSDLKLNQANESRTDSIMENDNGTASHETNTSKKSNVSIKQQMEMNVENDVQNKVENKLDTNTPYKVPILESDIDENEHIEMPSLLVEEEPEDVASGEKISALKSNPETIDIVLPNIATENRIHHKKRMLQNSRTAEQVKQKSSIESEVSMVSILSSNHDSISQQSIPSQGKTVDKLESSKTGLDSNPLDSQLLHVAGASSGQSTTEWTEKCDGKERYKKKILLKYENSNKIMEKTLQCDSSIITSCDTKANSSTTQCNNNNHNADSEKLMCKNTDITETPNHDLTSKKTDLEVPVCKEPIEVPPPSNTSCKNNPLQNCDKFKDENTTHTIQCEKRKRSSATEPETANCRKVLKSHKNEEKHKEVSNNPKTSIHKDSIVSLVSNVNTGDPIVPKSGNTHLNQSLDSSCTDPPKDISKEQSNEISSRSFVKNEKAMNNCKENLKSNIADSPNLNESPVINEDRNVLYLKRRTKIINTPKDKKIKRKLSSDTLEETEEEIALKTKKSKKIETKSPNKLKVLSSNSRKQIKPTRNKNKKSSTSPERPIISELNSDLIHHNIFSNDGCPEDRSLPVICNDNDVQYREIENRLHSIFHSPTYKSPIMENVIDPKCDTLTPGANDIILDHTINETFNKSEKSQCDTSSSSRKMSVGSNDYVIETVGAHVANVFVTRKKCKKRTKIAVATV